MYKDYNSFAKVITASIDDSFLFGKEEHPGHRHFGREIKSPLR